MNKGTLFLGALFYGGKSLDLTFNTPGHSSHTISLEGGHVGIKSSGFALGSPRVKSFLFVGMKRLDFGPIFQGVGTLCIDAVYFLTSISGMRHSKSMNNLFIGFVF